jgi:hypothetical protein
VSPREYRELVEGDLWPTSETCDRIEQLFGWPQTVSTRSEE